LSEKKHENSRTIEGPKARVLGGFNMILYGVPGAGKSYTIEKEFIDTNTVMERIVFHPDYTYSDFVGQILPKSQDGEISYQFVPGPFTRVMKDAYIHFEKKFILVIEEINRGNAPAIFGDIFQLLDRKDNQSSNFGESKYGIKNSEIAKVIFADEEKEIRIPSNLSLICTMNTADQNVFTLDTAFQRRWDMRLIENTFKKELPDEKAFAEKFILDTNITWEQFSTSLNKEILEKNQSMTSSEDKRLGTHFVTIDVLTFDISEMDQNISVEARRQAKLKNRRFPEKVIKYLWDDAFKFHRDEIFKSEFDSLEKVIKEFTDNKNNERFNIFKDNIKAAIEEIINKST
jgi:5-methylcytosine-specific restriction endonuclease McrBC GTP-binding regulatory subunit McrB